MSSPTKRKSTPSKTRSKNGTGAEKLTVQQINGASPSPSKSGKATKNNSDKKSPQKKNTPRKKATKSSKGPSKDAQRTSTLSSSKTDSKRKKKNYGSKLILPPSILMQQQRCKVYKVKNPTPPVILHQKRKLENFLPKQSYQDWYKDNLHKTIPPGRQKTLKSVLANKDLFDITIVGVGMDSRGAKMLGTYLMYNQNIWSIDLSRNNIAEGSAHIFNAVGVHRAIKTLILDSNGITKNEMKEMSDMLLDNELLQSLSVSGNYIDAEGTKTLVEALRQNVTLKKLNLSKQVTKIGADGAKAIADGLLGGMPLEALNISGNDIGHEGIDHIAKALKNIKTTFWGTLKMLDVSSNNLGRKGAKAIAACLATNKTLEQLNLSWNNLGQMKTVEKDPIGIKVISNAMRRNKYLKVLDLSGNNMSNRGATFISEMLQENKTLINLSLRCNGIESIAVQDLLRGFKNHKALSQMNLGGNTVPFGHASSTYDKDAWVHPELLRLRKPYGVELVAPPPKGFVLSATVPHNMMIQPGNIPKPIQPQTIDTGKIRSRWYV